MFVNALLVSVRLEKQMNVRYRFRTVCATWLLPLLLLLLPAAVQAQYTYTTNNNTITITGYTGSGGAVTIPSTINGLPVTSIGAGVFANCKRLISITIPDSVTSIADSMAFAGCTSLISVTIPDSVTYIGAETFDGCTSLISVTIPDSVTSIGYEAFFNCTHLINTMIGNSVTNIGAGAFMHCHNLTGVYFHGNAPSLLSDVFGSVDWEGLDPATVYYLPGATGFGTTFGGCPTALWQSTVPIPYAFANTPLWDVSGNYTNATSEGTVTLYQLILQHYANGQVTGSRTEMYGSNSCFSEGGYSVTGRSFGKAPTFGIRYTFLTGNAKPRVTATVVPSSLMLSESYSERVCVKGGKYVSTAEADEMSLPDGMNGDWSLILDTTAEGRKVTGTATITLSNGRTLSYQVSGSYNTTSQVAKLKLVGEGDATGSSLSLATHGTGMDLTALKGKVLGQSLTFP
jgi:hypothetical protein